MKCYVEFPGVQVTLFVIPETQIWRFEDLATCPNIFLCLVLITLVRIDDVAIYPVLW